uniref:Putative LOC100382917 [Zea mays] n=1 Tax=Lepeophtheirus salmonis TaxID=72036 RepID=A0A0K2SVE1_LEPSM
MNKSPLSVHEIKLMIKTSPSLSNGCGIGEHADGSLNLSKITSGHDSGRLVVDSNLEACRTPVHELNGSLRLNRSNGLIDILWGYIPTVQHATRHVFTVTRITLDHLVDWLEAGVGDLRDRELLVVSFFRGDNGGISDEGEVDTGIGNQIGLEFVQIHIEGSIKAERGRDGRDDLSDQSVEIGVCGEINVQVAPADVVDGFIVHHECAVRVLQSGVGGKNGVVGLHDGRGDLRSWIDGKLELRLLSIVYREAFHEKRREPRAGSSPEGVEDEKALQSRALVSKFADSVKYQIHHFLSNRVMSAGIVVGRVFLPGYHLLGVKQLAVGPSANLINH